MNDEKTILVTGGAGYIGSLTVKELLNNGYKVVVLDSLENGHREAVDDRALLEVADLNDSERTAGIFDKYKPMAVIDFAAYLAVGESMEDPIKYMENNVENFVRLLEVMKVKNVRYIIKSSTAATYGDPLSPSDFPLSEDYQERFKPEHSALLPGRWDGHVVSGDEFLSLIVEYYNNKFSDRDDLKLNENDLLKSRIPASVYGLTKLLDEIILKKYNETSSINYAALRYFNVCGAAIDGSMGDDKPNPTNLMTVVIESILHKNRPLKIFGNDYPTKDGTGLRDYIHPLDLASGHIKALEYITNNNVSETFNLGSGVGNTVLELINSVENASGRKVQYEIVERRSGDPAVSYADPTRAQKLLGWKAEYNLAQMAESAWKWQSKHPEGYRG